EEEDRGLVWKLPSLQLKELGKLDPAFVLGAGCGLGLIGGAGFGPGLPALELAFGLGAGCGVGLGFGYGMGRGIAHDGHRTSNVGKLFHGRLPSQDDIGALIDELVIYTKKLVRATSREIDTWRR
ncbi:LOW QUALITY PROTEIN: hypothetical protein CFOL_v3_15485, partial [Cephalotus follicularis]